jgi:AcrR family transcriptional regulator
VSRENRDERREQIMDAVVDITAAGGLQAATFRTVATRAGVSVRLVQYYFGDKGRLLTDTLRYIGMEVADRTRARIAGLGDDPGPREVLATICEQFLPADERRRRAMLVFIAFRTASLTDETLRSSDTLRLGPGLVQVVAEQLRRVRPDDATIDADATLLTLAIPGIGNGVLAGDITLDEARQVLTHAIDRALTG